ncbi:MAG: transglycosylase SLT domain-containing protein [Xanthomonadales bacterium]|nr:transglycosylase SLT domain-containing protein [Xanthomonadales bacterium]
MRRIWTTLGGIVCGLALCLPPASALRLSDRQLDRSLPVDESAVSRMYEQVGQATAEFQAGIEMQRSGQPRQGQSQMEAASARVALLAGQCAQMLGCEMQRFIDAFQALLRLQALLLDPAALLDQDPPPGGLAGAGEADGGERLNTELAHTRVMLRGRDLSEIIPLNEPVHAALTDWLTWMRPTLIEAWVNYQYLRADMVPAFQEAGLPEAVLFGILAKESAGRVHAVSRAGASGPLQFMPATGRRYGLNANSGFDLRFDPASASRASVAYLTDRLEELNHDLELSLAAYNSGEGRLKRLADKHRGKGFWSDSIYHALPSETQDYVPKVLAAAWLFLHGPDYGLSFPAVDTQLVDLQLVAPASLGELAMCFGQSPAQPAGWFRTLRNLNPRVQAQDRLPGGSIVRIPRQLAAQYPARCLDNDLRTRLAGLHDARYPAGPRVVNYKVRQGDTLARLARTSGCSRIEEIARLNGIAGPRYSIRVGQTIKLPTCS